MWVCLSLCIQIHPTLTYDSHVCQDELFVCSTMRSLIQIDVWIAHSSGSLTYWAHSNPHPTEYLLSKFFCGSSIAQLCPTICDPVDYSHLEPSLSGIFQERILQWVDIFSSRGSSRPRDGSYVSCIAGRFFTTRATWEVVLLQLAYLSRVQIVK